MQFFLHLVAISVVFFKFVCLVHIRHLSRQGVKLFGFGYDNDKYGLWPPVRNLALNAIVEANGTCGQHTKQVFCKLNDRQQHEEDDGGGGGGGGDGGGRIRRRSQQFRKKRCSFCDVRNPDFAKNHLADYLIDGTNRWWQSTSLFYGNEFEQVSISLTFREVYHVAYIIIKAANAPRPGLWILERSLDGIEFEPWQYFARDDAECESEFSMRATPGKPVYRSDTDVICTSYYSKLYPLENGEIHVSLINGRPGQNRTSRSLFEFTKARAIRFRLLGLRAQTEPTNRWSSESFRKKTLYYAISEIIVGGQCACNGHAVKADLNLATGLCECDCEDNHCGRNCEKCCPLMFERRLLPVEEQERLQNNDSFRSICSECNCNNHSNECRYDPVRDDDYCINCADSTSGRHCEECLNGYYRHNNGCKKCDCRIADVGADCRKFCDFIDSGANDVDGDSDGNDCKKNNAGCLTCEKGFFAIDGGDGDKNRDDGNESGKCAECFCLNSKNEEKECQPLAAAPTLTTIDKQSLDSLENWTISDLQNKLEIKPIFDMETKWLSIASLDLNEFNEFYYWKASSAFGGERLHFYGAWFMFDTNWVVMRGDSDGKPVLGPSMLIRGEELFIQSANEIFDENSARIRVRISEENFRNVFDNRVISRGDLMRVLSNVSAIFLRAVYHSDQIESNLEMVRWTAAGNGLLEQCECPVGFAGLWCQKCAYGFNEYREFNKTTNRWHLKCKECSCNNHSRNCVNNVCDCLNNTIGDRCERCANGFYGNPFKGNADDCKRCACPHENPTNNFSPNCQSDGADGYVCTQCPVGYVGDHCEICDYGYYGDPTVIGSRCRKCDCFYNLDCDKQTGHCLNCPSNTTGSKCEQCARYHYGTARDLTCLPCDCYSEGSSKLDCDPISGQCACKPNYTGLKCNKCKENGTNGIEIGCRPCQCHRIGAKSSRCDSLRGRCECRANVIGPDCDRCADFYWGLSLNGCQGCNCNVNGSISPACDIVTGQCRCKNGVLGSKCDRCEPNYWNLERGCIRCECNGNGTDRCDIETGRCLCKVGVGGARCDQCLPNYYQFTNRGCLSCENCTNRPGHVCDPVSGRCLCPANSYGSACQLCVTNSWGLRALLGCQKCGCSSVGSVRQQCNLETGQCECRLGYDGPRCDRCSFGYYPIGNNKCKPCTCNMPGTRSEFCNRQIGLCSCEPETGQCPCKSNVLGTKCDRCSPDSFNSTASGDGCVKCFCFGRSKNCTNAQFLWGQLRLNSSRELSLTYGNNFANEPQIEIISQSIPIPAGNLLATDAKYRVIPGYYGNVHIGFNYILTEPFYWQLPNEFLGDRLLSYGGYLQFTLEQIGGENFDFANSHPLVEIMGNGDEVIQFSETANPSVELSYEIDYEIRLHESHWYRKAADSLSRDAFMSILQKVTYIVIKASNAANFHKVRLKNVRLDSANLFNNIYTALSPHVTSNIELCDCPAQYSGTSCQNPNRGYYRWLPPMNATGGSLLTLGEARKCECFNRSDNCDMETGHCLNCSAFTTGPNCQQCSKGYYGSPEIGCRACECPTVEENNAETCYWNGADNQFICKCSPGYKGSKCTECNFGFYKNRETRECEPCQCDRYGSQTGNSCDPETGQCKCKDVKIVGLRCDRCSSPMYYLEYGQCKKCDNCTRWLYGKIANISQRYETDFDYDNLRKLVEPIRRLLMLKDRLNENRKRVENRLDVERRIDRVRNEFELYELEVSEVAAAGTEVEKNRLKLRKAFNKFEKMNDRLQKLMRDLLDTKSLRNFERFDKQVANQIDDSFDVLEQIQQQLVINEADYEPKIRPLHQKALQWQHNVNNYKEKVERKPEVKLYRKLWAIGEQLTEFADNGTRLLTVLDAINETLDRLPAMRQLYEQKLDNLQSFNREEIMVLEKSYDFDDIRRRNDELMVRLANVKSNRTIDDLIRDFEVYEEILDRVNYDYRKIFVEQALDHVRMLERKSMETSSALNITNGTIGALEAGNSYIDIVNNLKEAVEDLDRVESLQNEQIIFLDGDDELSLPKKTVEFLNASKLIKNETEAVLMKLNEIRQQKDQLQVDIGSIVDTIWSIGLVDNDIGNKLVDMRNSEAKQGSIIDLLQNYSRVLEDVRAVVKQTNDLTNDVNYKLRPKYVKIREFNDTVLSLADEKATEAQSNLRMSNDVLLRLEMTYGQNNEDFKKTNSSLDASFRLLEDYIRQARQTISGIQVSIRSSAAGNCARSYQIPNRDGPTIINRIKLTFVYSTNHENGTLVFISSGESNSDFLALDLIGRRPRFIWSLGGGSGGGGGLVASDYELSLQNETDQNYYEIVAERIGNVGRLRVRQKDDYFNEMVEKKYAVGGAGAGAGAGDRVVFDMGIGSRIFIGDVPVKYRVANAQLLQQQPNLVGCVHELKLDNDNIGLWNFLSTTSHCDGCTLIGGSQSFAATNMYYFNGNGYSVINRDQIRPYKTNQFSISLTFKTFDENALLFLALDSKDNDRFVAIYLRNGRVHFKIIYESQTKLELSTRLKYNNGQLTKLMGVRVFDNKRQEHVRFTVDTEDLRNSLRKFNESPFPDLQNAKFYFGGLNRDEHLLLEFEKGHFLGCLGEVLIDDFGYNLQDTNYAYGLSNYCGKEELKSLGFYGNGYVEMAPKSLKKTTFSLLFRTLQSNTFLLKCLNKNRTKFYSLFLIDGQIRFLVNDGRAELELKSLGNRGLNDGGFHAVTVRKNGRVFELRVNDELEDTRAFDHHSQLLIDDDDGSMYFGGEPNGDKVEFFSGAIKDVIFDNELVNFERLRSFENVEIGRLGPRLVRQVIEDAIDSINLTEMESQTVLSDNSYDCDGSEIGYDSSAVRVKREQFLVNAKKNLSMRNFTFEFDFRTFQENAQILLINSSSKSDTRRRNNGNRLTNNNNNNNYVLVTIKNAKLTIVMKVRKKKEISVSRYLVNDGDWHRISLRNSKRKFTISIDRNIIFVEQLPKKLFTNPRFFVNGADERDEGDEGDVEDSKFNGCLRNIKLNNKLILLSKQYSFEPCFGNVEQAVFFNRNSYAVQDNFHIKNGRLELEFELRPLTSRAVLFYFLGAYDNSELVVELDDGSLVLAGNANFNRNRFDVNIQFAKLAEQYCNRTRWYRISLIFSKDLLTIFFDGVSKSWLATNGSFLYDEIRTTMFIGGIRSSIRPETTTSNKYNYYGCLRNLKINQQMHGWESMSELNGLDLDGCPLFLE